MPDLKQIHLERRSPAWWRVTFDHPPLNIFGLDALPGLNEVVTAIETDPEVKVVVFDRPVEGFFITHYDFLADPEATLRLPPGPTGLQQLPDLLVRISRAPVVSIAKIRGRATGVGSELALASDMRFASRENRSFPDAELDGFVDALARRIATFDHLAIAETKQLVNVASLPADADIAPEREAFLGSLNRPAAQERIGKLMDRGFHRPGEVETRLGHHVGQIGA